MFAVAAGLDLAEHFRLERQRTGRLWSWQAVSPGESAVHAVLALLIASWWLLARPPAAVPTARDAFVVAAPLAILAVGLVDEWAFHRRRVEHREHLLHTTSHLALGAMVAFVLLVRVVPWER